VRSYGTFNSVMALATAGALVAALYGAFIGAPTENTMGDIQRIFYIHVPSAWTSFAAFFVVFVAGIAYLATKNLKWDRIALACAEIGTIFCTVVLITGPIWAKPVWGIWWTWDARLTSTLLLWLIYLSYMLLREGQWERDLLDADELWTLQPLFPLRETCFFENLFQGSHLFCLLQEKAGGLQEILLSFFPGPPTRGNIQVRSVGYIDSTLLEDLAGKLDFHNPVSCVNTLRSLASIPDAEK